MSNCTLKYHQLHQRITHTDAQCELAGGRGQAIRSDGWPGTCLYRICTAALLSAAQSDSVFHITLFMTQILIFITGHAAFNFIHDAYRPA